MYLEREPIARDYPEIAAEWDAWLDVNDDPGYYDPCKRWNPETQQMERYCDVYMPDHIYEKLQIAIALTTPA